MGIIKQLLLLIRHITLYGARERSIEINGTMKISSSSSPPPPSTRVELVDSKGF
jgi:hypothetical protein